MQVESMINDHGAKFVLVLSIYVGFIGKKPFKNLENGNHIKNINKYRRSKTWKNIYPEKIHVQYF